MSDKTILGVDPGLKGGMAVLEYPSGRWVAGARLPFKKDRMIRADEVFDFCLASCEAVVEKVWGMPGQGASSTFNFGRATGQVEGVIAASGVPISHVAAATWKRHHGLVGKGKGGSLSAAKSFWPAAAGVDWSVKANEGIAEAALIALWRIDQIKNKELMK